MASTVRPLRMAVALAISLLSACASLPANPAAGASDENCTGVQMQGNGGARNQCDTRPAGCWCQEM